MPEVNASGIYLNKILYCKKLNEIFITKEKSNDTGRTEKVI